MDIIEIFKKEHMNYCIEHENEANTLRKKFVADYPINTIQNLSQEDFLLGLTNENTFCNRLRYEMQVLASMGNAFPSTFGIYYKKGYGIKLSKTYEGIYGNNTEKAFLSIKNEIVNILKKAEKDDFSFYDTCELNSTFICKLIIVYFPQKVFPVCTKSALENYCRVLGMQYDEDENMIVTMQELLKWKQNLGEISGWSDYIYMKFGDWLWNSEKTINDCNISNSKTEERLAEVAKIEKNLNDIGVVGSDREVIVKQRVNQSVFRDNLLERYNKCCLCGVSDDRLLIASHIKPWSEATPEERVDIDNGFLFCPNHDKAFDIGVISFDDSGQIIISEQLDSTNSIFLNIRKDMIINLTDGNKKYLKYHREHVYNRSVNSTNIE